MKVGYLLLSPRVNVYDGKVHTITEDLVKIALTKERVKQKKFFSALCIFFACCMLVLGLVLIAFAIVLSLILLTVGGFMLHFSISSLKQSRKNIDLIETASYYFERAVCSEIEFNSDGNDTMHFYGKNYSTTALPDDRVGYEYYLLFFNNESSPVYVFRTSDWVLDPAVEKMFI